MRVKAIVGCSFRFIHHWANLVAGESIVWSVQLLWGAQQSSHHTWCQVYSPGGNLIQILRGEGGQHIWADVTGQKGWLVVSPCGRSGAEASGLLRVRPCGWWGSRAGRAAGPAGQPLSDKAQRRSGKYKYRSIKSSAVWYRGGWVSSLWLAEWKCREVSGCLAWLLFSKHIFTYSHKSPKWSRRRWIVQRGACFLFHCGVFYSVVRIQYTVKSLLSLSER